MELTFLSAIGLTPNDEVIAIFCVAIAVVAVASVWRLRENPYIGYLAASFSLFFISTAASILKTASPRVMESIEHLTLLCAAISLALAAYRYRGAGRGA